MLRALASCFFLLAITAQAAPRQTMKEFIDHLMAQMTDAEKVGQLGQYTADMANTGPGSNPIFEQEIATGRAGSVLNAWTPQYTRQLQELAVRKSRLGIPLIFGLDVIHGHRTILPIPLGEASSWNLPLIEKSARIAATEAAADGVHWTFAPMVDIARDPRWGRIMEGAGEDTYLGSLVGAARVRGFQGKLQGTDEILACVKHFAAYGAPIAGRDYNTVDISERTLHEVYMPPYRAALDAGAATVMTSFNEVNGVPSTSNQWLLSKLLRDIWGFKGFVVSDFWAIKELVPHGVAENLKRAAELAFNAGVDMDMQSYAFDNHLLTLIQEGKASREALDNSVRRILEAKYRLGLFTDPYRFSDEERAKKLLLAPEHRQHAREIAKRSIVLLKNDKNVLPLKREGRVALIGPMVDAKWDMLGSWSAAGEGDPVVSIRDGMESAMGSDIQFVYPRDGSQAAAVTAALDADKVVVALGEPRNFSGEASSRTRIRLPEEQTALLRAIRLTGKPVVLLLFNGRPLALEEEVNYADAVVEGWYLGTESGNAVADVLSGNYNPSGKLTVTFPYNEGQIPIYYAVKNTGRPIDPNEHFSSKYLDAPNDPLFSFGWGLSYTTFTYSHMQLSTTELDPSDVLKVSVTVTNSGKRAGEETVQMYVRDLVGSVTRPVKELKGFKKVFLQPGESRVVSLNLTVEDLKFYDINMVWTAEPGDFVVGVGGNSKELEAAMFTLLPASVRLPLIY